MTMMKALEQLNKEHYSLSDAHANREPQGYLQNMMRYAQAAGVTDLLAQLTWAWQGLDIELRTVTATPRSGTTLQEFSEELEKRQERNDQTQDRFNSSIDRGQNGDRDRDRDRNDRSANRSSEQVKGSEAAETTIKANEEMVVGETMEILKLHTMGLSKKLTQEAHNYHGSQMDHFDGTYPGNSGPLQNVQNENHSLNPSQSKMDVIEGQENKPPGPNMDANYTDAYHIEIPPKPLAYTCRNCRTKGKRVRITYRTQSSDQENQAKDGISEPAGSLVNGPETTAAEVGAHLVFSESSSPKVVRPVVKSDTPTLAGNVDLTVPFICVKNSSWKEKILPRYTRVSTVTEYKEEECYPVDVEDYSLAAKYTPVEVDVNKPETKLANGVTIYGDAETVAVLADVINAFPRTWSDSGDMVKITPEEHLSIPLTVDWNTSTAAKLSHWVYPMGPNERAVIDEEFDKMHKQGRMSWSAEPTPFSFPVFMVWKTVFSGSEKKPTKKGRVVVDIRGLNKITTTDAYPIPLQSEIISAVHRSKFISTMDCTGFFHQWPVKEEDRHKLTVVSHRGSERFNVVVMGFKNSPPYVQ
ncbi:probable transposable element [Lasallia pustulata]|uniref:Probable transposable element n=1 Tax=Lasallia pustulata TaxID=136370 RepID=A0A1W5D5I5_9LECA|nr:probable transposable element [Lasallia pustulata]